MKILMRLARSLRARASALWAGGSRRPPVPQAQGLLTRDRGGFRGTEALSAEAGFPQLESARDPELMRKVLQRHLQPLGEKAYQIRECQVSHVRYLQQGLRCTLQYALRLEEAGTGRERVQEVTGVIYAGGRARTPWEKLRRSGPGLVASDAPPAFEPFSYVPELDMLVQAFPYDRRLPALPLLMAGPPPELEPLLLAAFGPGHWRAEAWETEPVRYLAELSATLRLTGRAREASSGRVEEKRFYAKVYRNEGEGEQTHQVLQALWDRASAGGAGFTVGKPIAYLSDLRTLVQEESPGNSLREVLLRGDEAVPVMRKVARGLAALHLDHVDTPRRRFLGEEVALLKKTEEILQGACPRLGPEIQETVGAIIAGLEEVPPAPTHCDLHMHHILLDGDRLSLLDLDEFAQADPVLDVARVLTSLTGPLPHDRKWAASQAFVEEYFVHAPEAWRARLPFHYAGAVLKTAVVFFRRQKPGWTDKIEASIEKAQNSLAGRIW